MKSHWDSMPTIRVVDAGYLLAGLEPERKWQYAPPLVTNFFNLIRDKTGAVKLATLPGERMEITQAEFQSLKAEYGTMPATETTTAPVGSEAERLADRELLAAFSETVNNGAALNWRYWVHQLPTLTTAEAARLMCGLDPDLFKSLESRPNKNDQSNLCKKAAMIHRLAEREGKESATSGEWISWASEHQIAVHDGFRLEVESASAKTPATPAPVVVASDATPDPERRLTLLRALGGTTKYKNGDWRFTCIEKLVQSEKAAGRIRTDVKTIRSDLREAAQSERDAHSAGHFDGMGQR